jgi:hypothetical protein
MAPGYFLALVPGICFVFLIFFYIISVSSYTQIIGTFHIDLVLVLFSLMFQNVLRSSLMLIRTSSHLPICDGTRQVPRTEFNECMEVTVGHKNITSECSWF